MMAKRVVNGALNFIGAFVFYLAAFLGLIQFGGAAFFLWQDGVPLGVNPIGYSIGYMGVSFLWLCGLVLIGRLARFIIAGRWSSRRAIDRRFDSIGGTD